jgi:hypothetical protein
MPNESTKAAIQQLRDAGFEHIATHLRDMATELESLGASCSIGFVEWRPELRAAQLLIRTGDLKPCLQLATPAAAAARTSAPPTSTSAPTASSKKPGSAPNEQKES